MINDGINDVPDKTIALFYDNFVDGLSEDLIKKFVVKPDKKRDWFDPHFYNCLPLVIGNTYGFIIKSQYAFNVFWDGGPYRSSMSITEIHVENDEPKIIDISSHFGHGILTVTVPFIFRTPPGINLITMNPPNHIIKNATVLTGVAECDNLRFTFTFNIKIHEPNVPMHFPKDFPLAAFMPIPRYFADQFEIKNSDDIFSDALVTEELQAFNDYAINRQLSNDLHILDNKKHLDRLYFKGMDIYENKFNDHQSP